MIALVDYGSGNIKAIANIYNRVRIPNFVATKPEDLARATKIVLPGVGAFDQAMQHLNDSGLKDALNQRVLEDRVPFLGICVGMQLLARRSDEGQLPGLGWIDADVKRFDDAQFTQRTHLPHMGWNDVGIVRMNPLLDGLGTDASFYFLHSYYIACDRREDVLGETDYGSSFHCAVSARNVYGVQFHPEKSHHNGVRVLQNFAEM
jgi:glutamine amidotransferase